MSETAYQLDSILAEWHCWCRGFQLVDRHSACAMFTNAKSTSRQYDSENEVIDGKLHNAEMKTVDWRVSELEPLHRTAIGIHARNLVTGRSVWTSARLPADLEQRQLILQKARNMLINRLTEDGIL